MRRSIYLGLAAFVLLAAAVPQADAKPVKWSGNGHRYEARLVSDGLTWPQARRRARALGCGWYLATITSAAENRFVFSLVKNRLRFFAGPEGIVGPWLGGFQRVGSGEPADGWRWVTGEPFRYTNWNEGEPNNATGDEGFLNFWNNGRWNDVNQFGTAALPRGFIAEFDKARQRRCQQGAR
jgi:hypothetical protein